TRAQEHKSTRFGRIGVLAGGPSNEREISLRSGRAIHDALLGEGLDTVFLNVKNNINGIIRNSCIDVAFIALHGRFGEDGTVQRMLEDADIPYTGSGVEASLSALDKTASKNLFIKSHILVPKHMVLNKSRPKVCDCDFLGMPIVVKPHLEGSSIGLSIVRDKKYLQDAIDKAFEYGDKVILEEYIYGRELTVGILNDEALPVIEIVPKNKIYDYAAKYKDSATKYLVPAPIPEKLSEKARSLGVLAHKALGCRSFSRVDMMMALSGDIFVLEVNTIPGMTERSLLPKAARATGLRFGSLCVKILEDALSKK
ncbi:MAG: D-alanine--D-alanine ligase, partial [Candidatus Omnitrophota bacterium]|nr:D-alanine--D-alanine ligase [Candidatus Omnitrophota bacterium]